MAGYTPGPWAVEVDYKGDVGVFAPDYGLICYPVEDNYEANARAIAALPDLLAALHDLVDYAAECAANNDERPVSLVAAHAALQKAGV